MGGGSRNRYSLGGVAPALAWALLTTALLAVAVVDDEFERRQVRVDLSGLLDDLGPAGVTAESALGEVLWRTERPLRIDVGDLHAGDEVELRHRADCPAAEFDVVAGGEHGVVAQDSWQDTVIAVDRDSDFVELRHRGASGCDIHLSRITATNVVDFGRGLIEYYRYREVRPHGLLRGFAWLALLIPLAVLSRRKTALLLACSGLVALVSFAALSRLSGLALAVRAHSFLAVLVLVPAVLFGGRWFWSRRSAVARRAQRSAKAVLALLRRPEGQLLMVLLLAVGAYAVLLGSVVSARWDGDIRGLPRFKEASYFRSALRSEMPTSPGGHDGQFYALLASDPLLLQDSTENSIDQPRFRARRILLPLLAWLGTGTRGGSSAVVAYVVLTLLGSLAAVGLAGLVLIRQGASPWLCVLLALQAGTFVSVTRSMLDTSAVALTMAALLLSVRRPNMAAVATTGAVLCKETSLFVAAALGLEACQERRWLRASAYLAVPVAVLGAWWAYLQFTVLVRPTRGSNFSWPFVGLAQKLTSGFEAKGPLLHAEIAATASVLLGFAMALLQVRKLVRQRTLTAAEWNLLALAALATVASMKIYSSVQDYGRVFLLLPFLALVIAAESRDRVAWVIAGALATLGAYAGLQLWLIEL